MIVLEFLVFVISSGLFCSERFRSKLWAVLTAGLIATGSSLLFVYDLGLKMTGHADASVQPQKLVVVKTVGRNAQPAAVGAAHKCVVDYPSEALDKKVEGTTALTFKVLADGTVDGVNVATSAGSPDLDDAAVKCVSTWHYRPAVKNGEIVEAAWKASVKWKLPVEDAATEPVSPATKESADPAHEVVAATQPPKTKHAWYDVASWFSSD